jgi:hypothetical protein
MLKRADPTDIPLETATLGFVNTSLVPQKRGLQVMIEYADHINDFFSLYGSSLR